MAQISMKRIVRIGVIALLLTPMLVVVCHYVWTYPMRKDEKTLRERWLYKTPMGTSIDDVISMLNAKKLNPQIDRQGGFVRQEPGDFRVIGTQSICVELGRYREIALPPFETDVTIFWGFDENGKLIEIWVWKVTDSF